MLLDTVAEGRLAPSPQVEDIRAIDEPVTGILLAGGRSRRMGHDKAWADLAGRPMVHWVLDALREVSVRQIAVARDAAQAAGRLSELGLPIAVDRFPARGPLSGIHAGLAACETDLAVVVACDLPLVHPALLAFLLGAVGSWDAAVPYAGEGEPPDPNPRLRARDAGLQPLVAAYRRACVPALEALLQGDKPLPTTAFVSVIRARIVAPDAWRAVDPEGRSFFNVNTQADLTAAAQLLTHP